jgi:hypothetical protein
MTFLKKVHKFDQPNTNINHAKDLLEVSSFAKGIECIGFEGFDQVRFEGLIGVSKGEPSTSYPCVRGSQSNLIWAMR